MYEYLTNSVHETDEGLYLGGGRVLFHLLHSHLCHTVQPLQLKLYI